MFKIIIVILRYINLEYGTYQIRNIHGQTEQTGFAV